MDLVTTDAILKRRIEKFLDNIFPYIYRSPLQIKELHDECLPSLSLVSCEALVDVLLDYNLEMLFDYKVYEVNK